MKYILAFAILVWVGQKAPAQAPIVQGIDTLTYSVTLCLRLPNAAKPQRVYYKGETGHVYLRLTKTNTGTRQSEQVIWGFYPQSPVSSFFFKKVRSKLVSNMKDSLRLGLLIPIDSAQYYLLCARALAAGQKKYNLNRYNCYHYALELINEVCPQPIPVRSIRFPFLAGRGGSPVALYADLLQLMQSPAMQACTLIQPLRTAPAAHLSQAFLLH